ncbi:MAG: hypothetical protein QOI38_1195 [Sphingomonadales bacterium]|jgi:hypothetical protein|nr:hypothetical protein [Sphingomonadales bacterium]
MSDDLRALVAAELAEPVDPRVARMAEAVAAQHGAASRAVLFYGSCLREKQLDGLMLDFYLIVSDYRSAYDRRWLAAANRLVPPNVFPFAHDGLTAKYAVLSEADFVRECSLRARSVSVWARFAQPSRLVWAADAAARERAIDAVAEAVPTLFALTRPVLPPERRDDPLALFREGFRLTYGAEIRAERKTRSGSIVDAETDRYRRLGEAALARGLQDARGSWRWRQGKGKMLTVLRLAKASFTFAGGVDYLAWKISRHSGVPIAVRPWQRRWPLLAAVTLLPRLLKRGAIR